MPTPLNYDEQLAAEPQAASGCRSPGFTGEPSQHRPTLPSGGQLTNGLLIAESSDSVTLRQPEGREQTRSRSSIEEPKSSTKSLMPEGIEKNVSVEQMVDLLAFLKNR